METVEVKHDNTSMRNPVPLLGPLTTLRFIEVLKQTETEPSDCGCCDKSFTYVSALKVLPPGEMYEVRERRTMEPQYVQSRDGKIVSVWWPGELLVL